MRLNQLLNAYPDTLFVLGGDSNCRIGSGECMPDEMFINSRLYSDRLSSDTVCNVRGRNLLSFMDDNGFIALNGRSQSDRPANFTFCNANGKSTIDLVWVNNNQVHRIDDFTVLFEEFSSDHFPICVKLSWRVNSEVDRNLFCGKKRLKIYRWVEESRINFVDHMQLSPRAQYIADIDESYSNLIGAIKDGAASSNMITYFRPKSS